MFPTFCRRLAGSERFQNLVLAAIVAVAVLMGLETSESLMQAYGGVFHALNVAVQVLFVTEILIRLAAHWPRPGAFFKAGWNVFDFAIVTASLLPQAGPFATVARLARLLRVARLLSVAPELRLIITTMLRSIPSLGHVTLLIALLLYVYGIIGYHLFHRDDPAHWGTLGKSALTLFQILTLEGWVEVQKALIADHPWVWLFMGSYIVIAVFVVINLFIAVVLNNLENARAESQEEEARRLPAGPALERIARLRAELDSLEQEIRKQPPSGL